MSRGNRILVVDDDADIREALEQVMLSAGNRVSTAKNGKDALDLIHTIRPDVILLDLMMPVMDGFRFREAQKQDRTLADIPVVIISAVAAQNAAALGDVAACLSKPFSIDVLLDTISMCQRQESSIGDVAPPGQ